MQRAFVAAAGREFAALAPEYLLGRLCETPIADEFAQRQAWQFEIEHLQAVAAELPDAHFFMEFSIPRMGRRADAIIVAGSLIFVVEYKVGKNVFERHAVEQVHGYALDLKNFHASSHDKAIIPILVATKAPPTQLDFGFWAEDRVHSPICCNAAGLLPTLRRFLGTGTVAPIDAAAWAAGSYAPTPTIVEAAEALYAGHRVEEIARFEAGKHNLTSTTAAVEAIIADAQAKSKKSICFVTGVPGAGKTLAGLNIVARRLAMGEGEVAAFLSGNGPLVEVLTKSLERDAAKRAKRIGITKEELYRATRAPAGLIQPAHRFRKHYLDHDGPPPEHVIVFDEAQRAWDQAKATKYMMSKGYHDFGVSEPAFLLSVLDRRQDWCVLVCLIGDGQEIHDGEAGVGEWFRALQGRHRDWEIHLPTRLLTDPGLLDAGLAHFARNHARPADDALHLEVPVRSFRSDRVARFVAALLGPDAAAAAMLLPDTVGYPIFRTRSLREARVWLRAKSRANERAGLLASSNALRLKPEGLFVKADIDGPSWFLNPADDIRASAALEDVATEFDVQGLELDWTCVAWDLNFRRGQGWEPRRFKGTKWQDIKRDEAGARERDYVRNAYRVLLTRARQGMVIFVPPGDADDATRPPVDYDAIDDWLAACGIPVLQGVG